MNADGFVHRTSIRPDGSFEVRDLSYGTHWVSLVDSDGALLWRGMVPVTPGSAPLLIEVEEQGHKTNRGSTVSVNRLQRKLPAAAVRELRLAEKATGDSELSESIVHLRRAIALAPQMQDARNNLGGKYLRVGDYEAARKELEAAVSLDPYTPTPHVNLALALLSLNRSQEAEQHAMLAVRRDPLSPGANFAAGVALERLGRSEEALPYLDRSSAQISQALLIQARILLARSETAKGVAKLDEYVSRPNVPQRAEIQAWLDQLRGRKED
jgi:tetratricopeptide (TPR) repeat protein